MANHASSTRHVVFPATPMLEERHLQNCKIMSSRTSILECMRQGGRVAEVGVEAGNFSQEILRLCRPATLHLIDMDLGKFGIARRFADHIESGRVVLHEGDSSVMLAQFPDHYFDVIYVDADHSYHGVWRDIKASVSKLADEGFLIFNDYTFWSPWECMPYGVMQAVNEFCIENDWEAVYFALGQFMYCDIALRRRRA